MDGAHAVRHDLPGSRRQDGIPQARSQRDGEIGKDETEQEALHGTGDSAQVAVPVLQLPLLNCDSITERRNVDSQAHQGVEHRHRDKAIGRSRRPECRRERPRNRYGDRDPATREKIPAACQANPFQVPKTELTITTITTIASKLGALEHTRTTLLAELFTDQ